MVLIKTLFVRVQIALLVLLLGCGSQANTKEHGRVLSIIKTNKQLITNKLSHKNSSDDLRLAFIFLNNIKGGSCNSNITSGGIDQLIYILSINNYFESNKGNVFEVLECLKKVAFDQESHYMSLAFSMIDKNGQGFFKLMYKNFFSEYIPTKENKLALIELSMLECRNDFVNFLKEENYPENPTNMFTSSEYSLFKKITTESCKLEVL